jgi:alkylhydroperoxidase family enzyme
MNLVGLLEKDAIPFDTLHARYGALLELVRRLIGVVPNCDPYLEIWPTAFRTYNVMVPNFLNLPLGLWGLSAPKGEIVGLALYVASRTAACAYCSAHTCSFALRRGAKAATLQSALDANGSYSASERAVIDVAKGLARIPSALGQGERKALLDHFGEGPAQWIVLGISMMGFLNKFMDALGVELEESTVAEVESTIGPSGWTPGKHLDGAPRKPGMPPAADTFATKLSIVPFMGTALSFDRQWTKGVPSQWPAVGEHLRKRTGHDFPVLGRLLHGRAIRAIAVMLRDNLDPSTTAVGLPAKCLAGAVYATVAGDAALLDEVRALARHNRVSDADLDRAIAFASGRDADLDPALRSTLLLARAVSPSPANVDDSVVEASRSLPAAAIVEVVTWISVLQMLHRVSGFYPSAS